MMFVIATGGIDLSAGSIVGVAAVMMGIGTQHGWPVWGMEFAALATGAACGAFNGALIGWLQLSPILATLGTMILFSGLGLAISSGASFAGFPDGLLWWNDVTLLGIPVEFLVFVVVIALAAVLLHATLWGRYVVAIGSNHEAARYSGYPVRLSLFAVYSFQGLLCGGAAVLLTARLASARADMGQGLMLMAIAAVVLGGAPIAGGSASVLGTVTGVSAFYIVRNGLLLLSVPAFVQYALTSALLLVAVGLGNLLRGRGEEER
jgi:ribose/xylose/arabinose/galactoside ABC-type transport system permease subunit